MGLVNLILKGISLVLTESQNFLKDQTMTQDKIIMYAAAQLATVTYNGNMESLVSCENGTLA